MPFGWRFRNKPEPSSGARVPGVTSEPVEPRLVSVRPESAAFLAPFEARVRADWEHLGTKETASGTRCIGFVPQVGRAAWLHRFYAPCTPGDLDAAEQRMGRRIPPAFRDVLLTVGGLELFVAKAYLFGVRRGNLVSRSIEDPSAFSLEDDNLGTKGDALVIGGCLLGDGSNYVLRPDATVVEVPQGGKRIIKEWPSIEALLFDVYATLAPQHSPDGTHEPGLTKAPASPPPAPIARFALHLLPAQQSAAADGALQRLEALLAAGPRQITIGDGDECAEYELALPDELAELQLGYSVGTDGASLVGGDGGWQPGWVVIGTDVLLGDPLFVDIGDARLPVLTAMHGMGEWDPTPVAESLERLLGEQG
jgi:hypothetical protein